jgi:LPS-assembly protein
MKNKFFNFLIVFLLFCNLATYAEEFIIESSKIKILDKGNITQATGGVKITSNDGIEITGRELIYNKKKSILKIFGNVILNDKKNNIITEGEEYIYLRNEEKIKIFGNVILNDKKNNIITEGKEYIYLRNEEKILSVGKSKSNIKNTYYLEGDDLIYERKNSKIYSQKKSEIKDVNNNIFTVDQFKFDIKTNSLKARNLSLLDNENNKYNLDFAIVDLKEKKFLGSDIFIDFNDSLFGNNQNNPRLNANSLISEKNETKLYKGNFTTCNQKKDKCPPWAIYAEEVTHKKKEKRIEYKNAWLKIYDKPVLYFPYFFHPDPTVKRQSGFLMPTFQNSNNSGASLQIPYYKVISDRKDVTFFPRLFFDNEILLQTEYRQANKNSDLVLDFSLNNDNSSIKNHLFVDLESNKENKKINFHLETVSNDTYLKANNIESSINNDVSLLYSYLNYSSNENDSSLEISFETYENLDKKKTDRFEYIFPNFDYEKNLNSDDLSAKGELIFNTRGFNKNYNTNSDETILINELQYYSFSSISSRIDGLRNNYKLLIRNLNSSTQNSTNFKDGDDQKLLSTIIFESNFPLKKENQKFDSYLTPKLSARYSPNSTKNNSNLNQAINYENIFSMDRIDDTAVEGGESLTLGIEYSSKDKTGSDFINLSFANIFRLNENPDLPKIHGISNKRSDIIGKLDFIPSKFFDLSYQFSLDEKLKSSNYDLVKANFNINNFVTSFEYLEEDNYLNESSYIKNISKFKFTDNYSIGFETSKNLDQNITDYYNLIYEYENDCLTAAIEYNKSYYSDGSLKPDENILFSIKIIPFGKTNSPAFNKK